MVDMIDLFISGLCTNSLPFLNQGRKNHHISTKLINIMSYIYLYNNNVMSMVSGSKNNILHYPQLDTVLMVEEFVREHSGEFRKRALWENLPRKMMYQTFCVVFDYLYDSGKIAVDKEKKIAWIWNPELVRRYLQDESLFVR